MEIEKFLGKRNPQKSRKIRSSSTVIPNQSFRSTSLSTYDSTKRRSQNRLLSRRHFRREIVRSCGGLTSGQIETFRLDRKWHLLKMLPYLQCSFSLCYRFFYLYNTNSTVLAQMLQVNRSKETSSICAMKESFERICPSLPQTTLTVLFRKGQYLCDFNQLPKTHNILHK